MYRCKLILMLAVECHVQEAQKRSVQLLLLQKQLDRKVTDMGYLQHKLTCLHVDLGKLTKAKEVCCSLANQPCLTALIWWS